MVRGSGRYPPAQDPDCLGRVDWALARARGAAQWSAGYRGPCWLTATPLAVIAANGSQPDQSKPGCGRLPSPLLAAAERAWSAGPPTIARGGAPRRGAPAPGPCPASLSQAGGPVPAKLCHFAVPLTPHNTWGSPEDRLGRIVSSARDQKLARAAPHRCGRPAQGGGIARPPGGVSPSTSKQLASEPP